MRLLRTSFIADLLPSFAQPASRLNGVHRDPRAPMTLEGVDEAGSDEALDDPFSTPLPLPPMVRVLPR